LKGKHISTTFPTSKQTFTAHIDNTAADLMDAADINDPQDTVVALEDAVGYGTTPGVSPAGFVIPNAKMVRWKNATNAADANITEDANDDLIYTVSTGDKHSFVVNTTEVFSLTATSFPTAYVPTVVGGTSAGTPTYTVQKGEYSQIGKMVFFSARVSYSAHDGTGDLRFSLPVTAGTYDGFTYELVCRITEANLLDQAMWITASIATGGSFMTLQITRDSTGASQVQIINENTLINITGFYKVA